jgi:hypothetical protein
MALPPFIFSPGPSVIFTVSEISVIIIALVLMGLSITAYRTTNLKKTLYAVVIFALFVIQNVINYIDAQVEDILPDDVRFALFSTLTLAILLLFFFTIVKK